MSTITDKEADEWISRIGPDGVRKVVKEYHSLRQGLCGQVLLVPTGSDDWVLRAIATGMRLQNAENALRKVIYGVENLCAEARNEVRETTCRNCTGGGRVGEHSCCICKGTGLRQLN